MFDVRLLRWSALWMVMSLCGVAHAEPLALAPDEQVLRVPTRAGVQVPVLVKAAHSPRALVLLFAGGGGQLELSESGIGQSSDNFSVRTRGLFADAGIVAVVVDAPSDHSESLMEYRASRAGAEDTAAIVAWARAQWPLPIWLVATSRGTISAANAAVRGVDVQGVVLTSSVTSGDTEKVSLFDLALERITVPVLLVHHRHDACPASPLAATRDLVERLDHSPEVVREVVDGGDPATSSVCSPESPHGFLGLDASVVQHITDFMLRSHDSH